jgi:hypothetical protein
MKKVNNEISEFIAQSIEQIKKGLQEGYSIEGKFHFDISVTTERDKAGNIGLQLAGVEFQSNIHQTHRIQFSIIDEKSLERNISQARKLLKDFGQDVIELDRLEKRKLGLKK